MSRYAASYRLYVNSNNQPNIVTLVEEPKQESLRLRWLQQVPRSEGYPAIKLPWEQLTAIDLNERKSRLAVGAGNIPN